MDLGNSSFNAHQLGDHGINGIEYAGRPSKPLPGGSRLPNWGNLRTTEPFDRRFGSNRGLPIDRIYIHDALARCEHLIRGDVLEVKDATYTEFFGRDKVVSSTVLDIDESNPAATLIADLSESKSLPSGSFDFAILTQVLQYLPDLQQGVQNIVQALKPGGSALITAPAASRVDPASPDLWRFTPRGLAHLVRTAAPECRTAIAGYGNVLTQTAYLQGLSAEELTFAEIMHPEPDYPVTVAALVTRPK